MRYYVVGGEYADTSFTKPFPGTQLETYGPFSEREAKIFWRSITGKTVDNAMVRYVLEPEDHVAGKIYSVVGGEYADTTFTRIAKNKQIEVYGPFEKSEALGFWRGLTAKSVDDALVRYDIRKNYHPDEDGGSPGMKIGRSVEARVPLARTEAKSTAIAIPPERLHAFLMDGKNWPRWAIYSAKTVKPLADGTWELEAPQIKSTLKIVGDPKSGVLDYTLTASGGMGTWQVPCRIVAVPGGCVLTAVFAKPSLLGDGAFDEAMRTMDEEYAVLKKVLEGGV